MSIKTTNYQLTKLDSAEISSMVDINNNADKVDIALKQNHDAQELHSKNMNNPHGVTKAQIGLGDVDNTSDANKPISSNQQEALDRKADLGNDGKVPAAQLPSYVDDVLEYNSKNGFPGQGEAGKIYVATDTNLTYRWTGTDYVEISPSIALGETSSTAYRGDRGKEAYDHSKAVHARIDATKVETSGTNGNIKVDGVESKVYDDTALTTSLDNLLNNNTITAAMTAGTTIESAGIDGLNIALQNIFERLTTTEASMEGTNSNLTVTAANVKRTGNVVDLDIKANVKTAHTLYANSGIIIGTVPEGYRPSDTVIRTAYINQGTINKLLALWILSDGTVRVYPSEAILNVATGEGYRICTTYQL